MHHFQMLEFFHQHGFLCIGAVMDEEQSVLTAICAMIDFSQGGELGFAALFSVDRLWVVLIGGHDWFWNALI
jgi:hypothetical protein